MSVIEIGERKIATPTTWNDLPNQTLYDLYLILQLRKQGSDLSAQEWLWGTRLLCATKLLDIDQAFLKQWQDDRQDEFGKSDGLHIFSGELRKVVVAATKFMFTMEESGETDDETGNSKPATVHRLNHTLTKNPYPELQIGKETWFAPADALENLTLYELATAFTFYEEYIREAGPANNLLALLYRPSKPDTEHNRNSNYEGDRRLPYLKHETTLPARAEKMAILPPITKGLLLFWFSSCRLQIIESYPTVFKKPKEGTKTDSSGGWGETLLAIAEHPRHLEAVGNQH